MSTCAPYKQLGEVGGLLWLTSPRRFFFICIALLLQKEGKKKKKNPQNFLQLCHPFNRERGADRRSHSANTGCQLQRDDHHTHTLASHMFGSVHSHTRSAALSLSNFLTFPRTLICTSSPNSRAVPPPLDAGRLVRAVFSHIHASAAPFFASPAPTLTTSTKLTPQARSVESVGGVRCWHSPPHPCTGPGSRT